MSTPEPVRWLDDLDVLEPELAEGLVAYAQSGPTPEQQVRMLAMVEATVSAPPAASPGKIPWWKSKIVGLATVGLVGAGAWLVPHANPPARAPHGAPNRPTAVHVAPEQAPEPASPSPPVPQEIVVPPPASNPTKRVVRSKRSPAPASAPPIQEVPSDPRAELALLARARRVVAAAPQRALALTEEHARTYPAGAFVEEREVIAIEALVEAGQREQAERRAADFARSHPRSAHLPRVGVILGTP